MVLQYGKDLEGARKKTLSIKSVEQGMGREDKKERRVGKRMLSGGASF